MTWKWRYSNVHVTWLRHIDVDTTSFWYQMPTGLFVQCLERIWDMFFNPNIKIPRGLEILWIVYAQPGTTEHLQEVIYLQHKYRERGVK